MNRSRPRTRAHSPSNGPRRLLPISCSALAIGLSLAPIAVGQSLDLSTTIDYVQVAHHPDLVPQTGLTVEAWVVWNGAMSSATVVRKDVRPNSESYMLRIASGRPQWSVFSQSGQHTVVYPTSTMPVGVPVHLAATWNGAEACLYIDGNLGGCQPSVPTLRVTSRPLLIGAGDGSATEFDGLIDEVRIWDHARSRGQIVAGMNREIDCANGHVATWHFDGDLRDAYGDFDATAVGSVPFAPEFAPFDRALDLSSGTGYVAVSDNPALVPATEITVEAWVVWDGRNRFPTIVRKNPAAFMESYNLRIEAGRPEWIVFDPNGVRTLCFPSTRMPVGRPTHLAGTWDGVESKLYMNGDLLLTVPSRPGLLMSGGELRIGGGDGPVGNFPGQIDEVRIWDRARSQAEIRSTMLETVPARPEGLIAGWHFDGDLLDLTGRYPGQAVANVGFDDEFVPFGCDNARCFDPDLGQELNMNDDDLDTVSLPFAFPLPGGGTTNSIDVCSNGFVWLVSSSLSNTQYIPTTGELTGQGPRICAMWRDLNPLNLLSDDVYVRLAPDRVVITWHECVQFGREQPFTIQLQMFDTGAFRIFADSAVELVDHFGVIVGVSAGNGRDPGSVDLTAALPFSSGPTTYEFFPGGSEIDLRDLELEFVPAVSGGYDVSANCRGRIGVARTESFGVGCPASAPLTVGAVDGARPWVGRGTLPVELTGLPATATAAVLNIGLDPVNLDLSIIGMQGCSLYTMPVTSRVIVLNGGVARSTVPVLSLPSLVGIRIHVQGLALPSTGTALSVVSSNRLELVHGNF